MKKVFANTKSEVQHKCTISKQSSCNQRVGCLIDVWRLIQRCTKITPRVVSQPCRLFSALSLCIHLSLVFAFRAQIHPTLFFIYFKRRSVWVLDKQNSGLRYISIYWFIFQSINNSSKCTWSYSLLETCLFLDWWWNFRDKLWS